MASAVESLAGLAPPELVEALCERVRAAGAGAYAVDVTSPDVRELGLVVVKVLAPELCALDVPHAARFLGGSRLYDAPLRLGLRAGARLDGVNPEPHPFP
jgi:ribosomal protein S12 methylthiotransferase accessory factor